MRNGGSYTQKSSTVLNFATRFMFFAQLLGAFLLPLCNAPSNHKIQVPSRGWGPSASRGCSTSPSSCTRRIVRRP